MTNHPGHPLVGAVLHAKCLQRIARHFYYNQFMLTIVIQAGGQSRRMGRDKALLPFLGEPLIRRVLRRLAPIADELLVTTNKPADYAMLDVPLIPDRIPGRGALGGLLTALSAARYPYVAVVACDMPFANPDLVYYQYTQLANSSYDAIIPQTAGGLEPFHAVYRRETCLPAIRTVIGEDRWRVDSWFAEVDIHFLSPEVVAALDPDGFTFWNVNTPEEFKEAEIVALQMEDLAQDV